MSADTECAVAGCEASVWRRQWCSKHYQRWLKHGDPETPVLRHGHVRQDWRSPTYNSWTAMQARCLRPGNKSYPYYGGRGIVVCDRWKGEGGFRNFLADMGERPEGKSLDRIDSDGNYEPSNCRWATTSEQRKNQRPKRVPDHGTTARYRRGCKCEACRNAMNTYNRELKRELKLRAKQLDADSPRPPTRPDNGSGDGKANGGALLVQRQVVPALSDVDRERSREAA